MAFLHSKKDVVLHLEYPSRKLFFPSADFSVMGNRRALFFLRGGKGKGGVIPLGRCRTFVRLSQGGNLFLGLLGKI